VITILTIIGARPQIIKAAALSRAIRNSFSANIKEIIVHTGQHYDENMSEIFFTELGIPRPDYNLNVGSGMHGSQTALMIEGIEKILLKEKPDYMVLYGDTNSTLAGAIAASKLHCPVVHIEAGLRSFNKSMPEEINRIMCDHASTLLFSPTSTGIENLANEGFLLKKAGPYTIDHPGVFHCGDVMFDNAVFFKEKARQIESALLNGLGLESNNFILATIHRDSNTDDPLRLNAIFSSLDKISTQNTIPIVLPLHPRTSKMLSKQLDPELLGRIYANKLIHIIEPVSFLNMIALETNCSMVITDSGGVQKEAFFYRKPSLILRSETEWTEIVDCGAAIICNADEDKIISSFQKYNTQKPSLFPDIFGNGKSAEFICKQILFNSSEKCC
jgi:UDP-GlcNAc3NAcA epimerase